MIFWENQKVISAFYAQQTRPVCAAFQLTQMEFDIVMFLHNNPPYDTAADIVKIRMLTKSHVSSALKTLEEKGYIEKSYLERNRKSVHLRLTPAADALVRAGEGAQLAFGKQLFSGFSPEEIALCRAFFDRMCGNARSRVGKEG